jgi:CRISPR-associated protein Csb2
VFMALAAAWFETGEEAGEGNALRWLESLGDPQLLLPLRDHVFPRDVVEVYVPVNDNADPYDWPDKKKKATVHTHLGSVAIGRSRQARTFPCTWVGESPCFHHWLIAHDSDKHRTALERLCGKVTRIGHSSSLVRMWLEEKPLTEYPGDVWIPSDGLADVQVRRVSTGTLDLLGSQYNGRGRADHDRLTSEIEALTAQKKVRGKGVAERKVEIDRQIKHLETQRDATSNRDPIRPKLGLWAGYRRQAVATPSSAQHTDFDSDLLILTQVNGPRLPLASTLVVTQALRNAILKHCDERLGPPIPDWISGHKLNGDPLRNGNNQLAVVPLPFVGTEHADGHLLGAALLFPRSISRQERGRVLGRFLLNDDGTAKRVRLTFGSPGAWELIKRDWSETRRGLNPESWTAPIDKGATTWATVTPVVLDHFPKYDPIRERAGWEVEVADIITTACGRLGLAGPVEIRFGTTSWHRGSPRSSAKRRPLRGHPGAEHTATLGDGFPIYPAKGSNGVRPQLHVHLRFAEPVVGPVLLCAGRFLGYGFCKPLWEGSDR